MHVFTVIHNIKYFEHRRFRIITWWKKRREHLAKKIIAQRSPLFSPEQHSKTTAFTFLLVQLFFFFSQCEEKTSPFLQHSMKTGGNGGRRGVGGTQEWSCLSESIDRAKTRSEGEGEGGGLGRCLRSDTLYDDVEDPGQRTEPERKGHIGRRAERQERQSSRDREWRMLGIPKSTYTAPGGSGHLDWPWCGSHYM